MKISNKSSELVRVVTLGCSKNIVDSERLIRQFSANNINVVFDDDDASDANTNTVIINTCGFISDAKKESVDTILSYAKKRKNGSIDNLFVMGCLSERYKNDLKNEIPEVDAYFGVNDIKPIIRALGYGFHKELLGERVITTPPHYAYFKIAEGCNRKCSFCAIPMIRGKYHSTPVAELIQEAKFLASKGVKELILIAQDLSYYGFDIDKKYKLHELVGKLSDVKGIGWIRLHYAYPTLFPIEILDLMMQKSNLCHYIDIPFQHISDRLLKQMRRGHDEKTIRKLVDVFRKKVPDISLRTSMIVGFPGETEKDFRKLCDFVSEARFERLGVFTYSHEEQTWAGNNLKDSVPDKVKKERFRELMKIQYQISLDKNKRKIGEKHKVLIDRKENNIFIGRTQHDSPGIDNEVIITGKKPLLIGDFYDVTITKASAYDLYGTL